MNNSDEEFKILPLEFSKNQFDFKQIKREANVAIYSKVKKSIDIEGEACPQKQLHYEVIKINRHDAYFLAGNKISAGESYPSNEQWGNRGLSTNSLERAEEIFKEFLKDKTIVGDQIIKYPKGQFTLKQFAELN